MMTSLVMTVGLSLLLYLSGIFVFFSPLPLALMYLRRGFLPALIACLIGLFLLFLFYRYSVLSFLPFVALSDKLGTVTTTFLGLLSFLFYSWMALVLGYVARQAISMEKGVLASLLITILFPFGLVFLIALLKGVPILSQIRDFLENFFHQMIALQEGSGLGGEELLYIRQFTPHLVSAVFSLLPALGISFIFVTLTLNILFLRRWAIEEHPFSQWVPFPVWRLSERWIWIPIGSGLFYFMNLYLLHLDPLQVVLFNFFLLLAVLSFYQGLAVMSFFFQRRFSPWVRLMAYLCVFLFIQVIAVVIIGLGLFDFWFDFRKLKKVA